MRQAEKAFQRAWKRRAGAPVGMAAALVACATVAVSAAPSEGVLLWYPESSAVPSDRDCRDLVARVQPSRKKAEDWLWGRVPEGSGAELEFYLFVSGTRLEPTFAAEGDYDAGTVEWGETRDGTTSFTLTPDDHAGTRIEGTVVAREETSIVIVTLRDIPLDDGKHDRTNYYCRFEEGGTVT